MPELTEEQVTAEPVIDVEIERGPVEGTLPDAGPTTTSVVPIPGTRREEARPSFWRRISIRANRPSLAGPGGDERVLARLDVIDSKLVAAEQSLQNRIGQLEHRFTEVWEVEEQLSHLMEMQEVLGEIRERQAQVDARLEGLGRRLLLLAVAAASLAAAMTALALTL